MNDALINNYDFYDSEDGNSDESLNYMEIIPKPRISMKKKEFSESFQSDNSPQLLNIFENKNKIKYI